VSQDWVNGRVEAHPVEVLAVGTACDTEGSFFTTVLFRHRSDHKQFLVYLKPADVRLLWQGLSQIMAEGN